MRQDKLASLKQRLHRGADAFEFQALIQGVSTLEEEQEPENGGEGGNGAAVTTAAATPPPAEAAPPAGTAAVSPAPPPSPSSAPSREERLRAALEALSGRLAQEIGRMQAAMRAEEVEEAGFYLAHVNQILELLRSIDPTGDLARHLGTPQAPPANCSWPATAWSVVEFAESPLSALLPAGAGEAFVRSLLYAAWGVTFEPLGE